MAASRQCQATRGRRGGSGRAALAALLLVLAGCATVRPVAEAAQGGRESGLRTVDEVVDGGVELSVENSNLAAVTLTVTVLGVNATPDKPMPVVVSCPGKGRFPFVRLKPIDESQSFSWRVKYDWRHGQTGVNHDDRVVYELPFKKGQRYLVRQGFHGEFTHTGNDAYAVDFEMPEGTPVLAARGGTVDWVVDRYDGGGVDPRFRDQVNLVLVRHPDGTYGEYVHLRKGGVRVKPGQSIKAGDLVGYSGNVGYTRGPHLHFAVFRTRSGTERETFRMRFRTVEGPAVEPVEGQSYTAP